MPEDERTKSAPPKRPSLFPPGGTEPTDVRISSRPPLTSALPETRVTSRPPSGSALPTAVERLSTRPPAPTSNIKGFALERMLHWYAQEHGDARLREILLAIPKELRGPLDLDHRAYGVIATDWYPAALVHRMFDDMTRGLDTRQREAFARGSAEATVRAGLRGVYKVLFSLLMNPKRYAARAQSLWERYYDAGVMEKTVVSPTHHHTVIRGWASHHPLLCEINAHSAQIIYEELGCNSVRVARTGCVSRGDRACTQDITWVE